MGIFSRFEGQIEDSFEGAANKIFDSPISPVQIAKKAEKKMRREKIVGAGKQFAPTLYTVLVNDNDDRRLFGYYPTLAGETETYLAAKAMEEGLVMDGQPLVRFIVDDGLKRGKFDVIAELVSAPIVSQLREEEMNRYGLGDDPQNESVLQQDDQGFQPDYQDEYYPEPHQHYVPPNMPAQSVAPVVPSAAPQVPIAAPQVPAAEPTQVPNTVVFTPGSGNAQPSPRSEAVRARLINTTDNRAYDLATTRILLGRERTNDIVVDDINASRVHAELRLEPQGVWSISDLGSTNGTLINGVDTNSQVLQDGDYITIGMTNYVFMQS